MSALNHSFYQKHMNESHNDGSESNGSPVKQDSNASKGKTMLKKLEKKLTANIVTAVSMETAVLENTLFFPKLPNIEIIGKGGFSQVFRLKFQTLYIAKKEFHFFSLESFLKEYGFIRMLRHPSIPQLYGCHLENNLEDIMSFIRDSEIANKISASENKTSLSFFAPNSGSPQHTPSGNFFLDDKSQFFELNNSKELNMNMNSDISQTMSESSINQLMKFKENNLRLKLISKCDVNFDEMSFTNNLTLPSIPEPMSCKTINKIIKHMLELNTKSKYVSTTLSSFSKSQFRDVSELKFSLLVELVNGKSLDEILSSITSDLVKLLLMIDISQVMKFLHDNGVIHRDLKPNNIMINLKDLRPKVLDFGISKLSDRSKTTTLLKGTLAYMAPENFNLEMYGVESSQNGNKLSKINNKIDVWAFGCILNEVFSKYSMKPWEGEDNDNKILTNLVLGKQFPVDETIDNIYIKNLIIDCTLNDPESRPNFHIIYRTLLVALKEQMQIYNGKYSRIIEELAAQMLGLSSLGKVDFQCSKKLK